jgi:hypothetical protein
VSFGYLCERRLKGSGVVPSHRFELITVPRFDNPSVQQQRRTGRMAQHNIQRMCRQQYGAAPICNTSLQITFKYQRARRIEPIEGFIQHDERRIAD